MKRFITYIKEIFDSKSYRWLKSNGFQKIAVFNDGETDHYINFDEFMTNAYNLYFYHYEKDEKVFYLTKDRGGKEFIIFGNVKNCVDEFINTNPDVLFIGFSSYENERNDLYFMFLQHICKKGFKYFIKNKNNISYYFIISDIISILLRDKYIDNFIQKDKVNKKI